MLCIQLSSIQSIVFCINIVHTFVITRENGENYDVFLNLRRIVTETMTGLNTQRKFCPKNRAKRGLSFVLSSPLLFANSTQKRTRRNTMQSQRIDYITTNNTTDRKLF